MSIFRLVAFLGVLLACAPAAVSKSGEPPPATIAELEVKLNGKLRELGIPGAGYAIIENNRIVLANGYGAADIVSKKKADLGTLFRAGSISKNFVGVAVMMLVEEGKLDLNAKLSDLAPEIKFVNRWEATDPVRLMHLMEHTTGFNDIRFSQYLLDGKDMPLKKAIELYGPYESRWRPGAFHAYSNAPPVIAAYIVEKVSGMSWAEFTRMRIFEPLGMTSAHWDKAPQIVDKLAKSYRADGLTEESYVDIPGKPAGSLNVTPIDLAKFAMMMIGRGTAHGVTLLKPDSVMRIESPQSTLASRAGLKLGYGLGNTVIARERSVYHGHDGGIDGFLALYGYDAENKSGFVIMVNQANGEAQRLSDIVISYLERNLRQAGSAKAVSSRSAIKAFAGNYQSISPRQQMLAPLEAMFDWSTVGVENGKLFVDGVERVEVSPRVFQRLDRTIPSLIFVSEGGRQLMLTGSGARRLVPEWEVAAKAVFAAAYGLATLFSSVYLVIWIIGWWRGRLSNRGGVMVRVIPALAIASLAGFMALLILSLVDGSWETLITLGTKSNYAMVIYWLSYAFPAFGALSLVTGIAPPANTPLFARSLALLNGLVTLTAAVFLWPYGWIGLQTWI